MENESRLAVGDIRKKVNVTVKDIKYEPLDGKQSTLVAYFHGVEKGLVLSEVNAEDLVKIAGSRKIVDWVGTKVCLLSGVDCFCITKSDEGFEPEISM